MRWKAFSQLVVLPYTLFALPWFFACLLLVPMDPVWGPSAIWSPGRLFWMLVAFVAARVAGMSFNRVIDHAFDAQNPRTKNRVLVTGEVSRWQVQATAWGAVVVMLYACSRLNAVCLLLAPPFVALLWGYSYLKRFTPWCQVVMAVNHALIPVFVWAALTGHVSLIALFLGVAMGCLFAAHDIIYGIQDVGFDREKGLYSIASVYSPKVAVELSWGLQFLGLCILLQVGWLLEAGVPYYLGLGLLAALVAFLDSLVNVEVPATVQTYLFRTNVSIGSCFLGIAGVSVLYG